MKFRKRDVVVDAVQMTKDRRLDNRDWPEWLNDAWSLPVDAVGSVFCSSDGTVEGDLCTPLFLNTRFGVIKIEWDNWLILDESEELITHVPEIFPALYDPVEGTS